MMSDDEAKRCVPDDFDDEVKRYVENLEADIRTICAGPRRDEFMRVYRAKVLALDHNAPENKEFLSALYKSDHPAHFILEWHDAAGRQ